MLLDTTALPIALAPELAARGMSGIRKAAYQEMGGSVLWTLHPTFDIRLAGNIAMPKLPRTVPSWQTRLLPSDGRRSSRSC